jgi:hypothetical protein
VKIAFLTELPFEGKVVKDYPNMRTEFAWMYALNADHYHIYHETLIENYDYVFVIFPKGRVFLDACGSKLSNDTNPISHLLSVNLVEKLKKNNKKVYYIQEGPHWLFNDYELVDQINFYNMLISCDGILAHNNIDLKYYKGLFPGKLVEIIPTLMIEDIIKDIKWTPEEKVIIGGNLARWYGGFESYMIAQEFEVNIWGQTSHAMRNNEEQLFEHLPRVLWTDWMKQLSSFKYAVHLMPTVAAGTFSLNCAYFGIPCIGNKDVDTQKICHPWLSVDVYDLENTRKLAKQLVEDKEFYKSCSDVAKANYQIYYNKQLFIQKITNILTQ